MRMLRKFRLGYRNSETNDLAESEGRLKLRLANSMHTPSEGVCYISQPKVPMNLKLAYSTNLTVDKTIK